MNDLTLDEAMLFLGGVGMNVMCTEMVTIARKTFMCELPHGHDGDHIAHQGDDEITWGSCSPVVVKR